MVWLAGPVRAGIGDAAPVKPLGTAAYVLAAVLIASLISAVASLAVHRELAQYRERTATATQNTAMLIDQVIESMFAKVDVSLQTSARFYMGQRGRGKAADSAIETFLAEQRRLQPEITSLRIADAQGTVVHGLEPGESRQVSLADRAFFKGAQSGGNTQLIVVGPVLARIAQKWVLVLARRLEDEQGRFMGVVYANIAVETFQAPLSKIDLGTHGAATLRASDLALIYRSPKPADAIGSTKVSAELASLIKAGRPEGSYAATTALDGIERVNAYRRVGSYPVYVVVGAAPQDQYGDLSSNIALVGLLSLAALAVVLASAYVVWKTTNRLDAELSIRQWLDASLRQARHALDKAQEISKIGNWVWELQTGKTSWSAELFSIHQLDPSNETPSFDAMERYFEPDDWLRVKRAVEQCATKGIPYDLDARLVRPTGDAIWINAKGVARWSESGAIVELHGTVQDITERKRLELALGQANDELDDLYNNVPCGYYSLDATGRYVRINATMLNWIGYSRDEAIGKLGSRDSFSDASRAKFDSHFPRYLKTGRLRDLEFELVHRSGQRRTVSVSASAIYDEHGQFKMSRSVMFDVTELRRAQAQVTEIKSAQNTLLRNEMVGVVRLRDRQITWFNPALCDIFGYSPAELEGQSARVLYADDASFEALGRAAYPRVMAGDSYRTQLQMRHKDGSPLWIDVQGVLVDRASAESLWMTADITALRQRQDQFEFHALHDALTGLANRALLHELIPQALANARRQNTHVAVCFLDLDRFKPINDHHGHAVGDEVLKEVSQRLLACVREADVVARVGGDEFVLLLTGLDSADGYQPTCERARAAISAPFRVGYAVLTVGVAIGVAVSPVDGDELEGLMRLADERMYLDKAARGKPSRREG